MKQFIANSIKSVLGSAEYLIKRYPYSANELVVVCMHSTPTDRTEDFELLVLQLTKSFKPFSPDNVEDYFVNKTNYNDGPYILFTFDDGLQNNLNAGKVLQKLGISGLFFVIPDFIQSDDQPTFYRTNIRPCIDYDIDHEPEDVSAMSLSDLRKMIEMGHSIGSHTMTHTLSNAMDAESVTHEVCDSERWLREKLGLKITAFASPNNSALSVNSGCAKAISHTYLLHYTTFPGLNIETDSQMIYRRNIEVFWNSGKIKFAMGLWDLRRWKAACRLFQLEVLHR
jgi:peptidoglycan/xylan/chitin deacetylase (PgdA/CDA1 family)